MIKARLPEWLWRGRAIDAALERLAATEALREVRERARIACELGERAEEPSEPFAPGPDAALACELYREASHGALVALTGAEPMARSLSDLWQAADVTLLLRAARGETRLASIRACLEQPSFVDYAALLPAERTRRTAELRVFARTLVDAATADETSVRGLFTQRRLRVGLCLILLAFGIFRLSLFVRDGIDLRADLARGKPWRASSEAMRCDPDARRCGNYLGMTIFVHTREEPSPWLEIDLQQQQQVSGVRVRNRTDCCSERAVPLVVELSADGKAWREVTRRNRNFRTWTPRFAPADARWVRLRVDRTSALHLERVSVYR